MPLARVSSLSLMVYELALISDSQIHVLSSPFAALEYTVILSATKNAE